MAEEFSLRVNPHTSLTGRGQNDRKAGRIECLYPMILSRLVLRVRCSDGEQVVRPHPFPVDHLLYGLGLSTPISFGLKGERSHLCLHLVEKG